MEAQMMPICSELKSKRIKWVEPQNYISWAYMKELRENNKTRKIYDIDPYVEVYQFRENMYGLFSENADGMGDVWMYLTVGPEKALLVDTSFGIGNLKGLVEMLAEGKEVIVVNTHATFDHSYGNCQFDRCYCHKYAAYKMQSQQNPHIWDYLFDEEGNNIWLEFDRRDIIPFREFEIVPCENGHIFDLGGGHEVELVWMPGHQAGHAMYLDKKNRVLFAGDDVCSDVIGAGGGPRPGDPYGKYCTISAFREELFKLCQRLDEFDYLFPGHFMVNLESGLLMNILDTCDAIIADPKNYDYKKQRVDKAGNVSDRYFKYVRGFSAVAYNDGGVY